MQGALQGYSFFVGTVAGHQGIKDIRDGHHARAKGDSVAREALRVPTAIELLMVPTGDIGHTGQIFGPGNRLQELKTVDHVPFDFLALLWGQSTTTERQHLQLSLRQEGMLLPIEINKHPLPERCECCISPYVSFFCIAMR